MTGYTSSSSGDIHALLLSVKSYCDKEASAELVHGLIFFFACFFFFFMGQWIISESAKITLLHFSLGFLSFIPLS